jgi:hypothetical protein
MTARRVPYTLAALALGVAAVFDAAPAARAQSSPATQAVPTYRLRILGVFDEASGEPVEGADVIDVLSNTKAITTKTGTVSLFFLPDGGSMVRIRKLGYELQTFMVAIDSANKTPITVLLKPVGTTLPTVTVTDSAPKDLTPRLRQFEEHRKGGFGQFLPEEVFRKSENTSMANLMISHFSGLQTVETSTGATLLVSTRTPCKGLALTACQRPNCFVTVYIDGVRVYDSSMPASASRDMGRMSPIDFAAAEFYPGGTSLPAGLSPTGSQCGTLVLYTRDR